MHNLQYTDETLDIYSTSQYRLSIQISLDGFSFSILDPSQQKYIYLRHIPIYLKWEGELEEVLEEIVENNELLTKPFKSVSILYNTPQTSLVPAEMFNVEDRPLYYYQAYPYQSNQTLKHTSIRRYNIEVVYAMPRIVERFLNNYFQDATVNHHSLSFIENGLDIVRSETACFLFVHQKHIELFVGTSKELIFYNQFSYKNENDIAYFTISVYKQLKLDAERVKLILSGFVNKGDSIASLLNKYIREIRYQKLNPNFAYSYTFNQTPKHYFSTLINLYQCEL